jgi:hypothetical protein
MTPFTFQVGETQVQKWLVPRGRSLLRSRDDGSQDHNR